MFENQTMSNDIQEERDVLGGSGVRDSAIYDFTVKMAYGTKSSGGATALVLAFEDDKGQTYRETLYTTSKDGKNYYEKDGVRNYLPGFLLANNLCLLTVKKEISQVVLEEKVIPIYDFDQKKELPTKAKVALELIGQKISAGILKETVDKTVKNTSTGKYEPTGETKDVNVIDKFFRIGDGFTVAEIRGKADTATFKDQWAAKNTGVVRNKVKGAAAGISGQASGNTVRTPEAAAGKSSLFDE